MFEDNFEFIKKCTVLNIKQIAKIDKKIVRLSNKNYIDENKYAILTEINQTYFVLINIISNVEDILSMDEMFDIYNLTLNELLKLTYLYDDVKSFNYNKKISYEDYKKYEDIVFKNKNP